MIIRIIIQISYSLLSKKGWSKKFFLRTVGFCCFVLLFKNASASAELIGNFNSSKEGNIET